MPSQPLIAEDGEVRELSDADFARGRIGAPWTRPTETARAALCDAIAALERAQGRERVVKGQTVTDAG